ncbi:hypothetical protein A2671_01660 [Candidatus Kaiserbacteria bacterium RIFCSPHIGHO2_01_FULL_49_13]|uniref:Uncharacterized protein n=1 Tax=Candidatus Kaiserbacteria bacterium RIFCSPHIGHO2_01_FULL_49_13 TaxID=1798477 RepID=A0A1F6CEK9_9BACT|nr:MAG: hypothetical protein A2671_01660 [Candidatus Kaiserbacteria bacterium RIFCSPHIGHO2_01_FULL_49_13]
MRNEKPCGAVRSTVPASLLPEHGRRRDRTVSRAQFAAPELTRVFHCAYRATLVSNEPRDYNDAN